MSHSCFRHGEKSDQFSVFDQLSRLATKTNIHDEE